MSWYRDFGYYPPSTPRTAKGGIKAQSKRGSFGSTWWGKRWEETLESFHIGARLTRGRSYARKGQVLSIDIEPGKVAAKVQGSRATPYKVSIGLSPLSAKEWDAVLKEFAGQAIYAAKLLAGEMPSEIENVFAKLKLSLFPKAHRDLKTNCSCPDYSNPCKHIASVYYLLAEEFDRDPFLLFRLRGMEREQIVERLAASAGDKTGLDQSEDSAVEESLLRESPPEPLPLDLAAYWRGSGAQQDSGGGRSSSDDAIPEVRSPKSSASLPKRLGGFPFWRGEKEFLAELESLYHAASQKGMQVFLANRQQPED